MLLTISSCACFADSIDWEAPWANEGGKAKKASPTKKILFLGLNKSLLTNIGKHFILLRLSKEVYL